MRVGVEGVQILFEAKVKECGFEPMGTCCEWRSVYWNADRRVMLPIFVDDFKLAGPKQEVAKACRRQSDVEEGDVCAGCRIAEKRDRDS